MEKCFEYLKAPCARVTGYDIVIPYDKGEFYHIVTDKKIIKQIENSINFQF